MFDVVARMKLLPSLSMQKLLQREGYFLSDSTGRYRESYVRLSKWFVSLKSIRFFLKRNGLRLSDVKYFGVLRLYKEAAARNYQFIRFREKEFNKLSMFDLRDNIKTVLWDNPSAMNREMAAFDYFTACNINVPFIVNKDVNEMRMSEKIVGEFLKNYATYDEVIELLLKAHTAQLKNDDCKQEYRQMSTDKIVRCSDLLSDSVVVSEKLKDRLEYYFKKYDLVVPQVLAHGDPSRFNVLLSNAGSFYLNDFDRSFIASIYYDFVYLYINNPPFDRKRFVNALMVLQDMLGFNRSLNEDELFEFSITLFYFDLLRWIASCVSEESGSCYEHLRLSIVLVMRAAHALGY